MSVSVLPSGAIAGAGLSPAWARALLVLVVAGAAVAGFLASDPAASAHAAAVAGPDLTRLMRAMAGLKALMALGMTAAVVWRLGAAASWPWFLAYAAACSVMAAGPGVIWDMQHVVIGAVALHGGLLASLVLVWRDPAVRQRLDAAIAARRARLRAPA